MPDFVSNIHVVGLVQGRVVGTAQFLGCGCCTSNHLSWMNSNPATRLSSFRQDKASGSE